MRHTGLRLLLSVLVALCGAVGLFWGVYALAFALSPPLTPDGHPVMPTGQLFLGLCAAVGGGPLIGWRFYRFLSRNNKPTNA